MSDKSLSTLFGMITAIAGMTCVISGMYGLAVHDKPECCTDGTCDECAECRVYPCRTLRDLEGDSDE